jgi:hypothetical protein
MKFEHIDGRIYLQLYEKKIDVTDSVMPVVDDYLDFHLGLVGKHEMKRQAQEDRPLTDAEKLKINEEYHKQSNWR